MKENDVEDEEEEGTTKLPFTHLHYSTTSLFCFFVLFSSDDYLDSTIKGLKEKKIKFLIFFLDQTLKKYKEVIISCLCVCLVIC